MSMGKGSVNSNGRVCFIIPGNVFSTPYLHRYLSLLQKPYDLILWNCAGVEEQTQAQKAKVLNYKMASNASIARKAIGYFRFKCLAEKILKSENYDRVIVLTGNAAVLIGSILKKCYKGRYLIDIRDYYKENLKLYYEKEREVIESSGIVVISSKGYKAFLPKHDYIISHNITLLPDETIVQSRNDRDLKQPLTLSYIGNMRFPEVDKQVLSCFANDTRYHINLIGNGYGTLRGYCQEHNIKNVSIIDWFPPEKTTDYYLQTDIVLNLYGNNSPLLDYALSNKLYYAAQLGKPILVCSGTYMEAVSTEHGFGFTFDLTEDSCKDALFDFYTSIDWTRFYHNCDAFLTLVKEEDAVFEAAVSGFINGKQGR